MPEERLYNGKLDTLNFVVLIKKNVTQEYQHTIKIKLYNFTQK